MNVTEAITAMCEQLDVAPIWAKINESPPDRLVMRLVMLSATMASGLDFGAAQQEHIAAALDGAPMELSAETHVRLALQMAQVRDEAVDQTRLLLGDLIQAGIVR